MADLHAYRELLTWDDTDLLDLVSCKIEADAAPATGHRPAASR